MSEYIEFNGDEMPKDLDPNDMIEAIIGSTNGDRRDRQPAYDTLWWAVRRYRVIGESVFNNGWKPWSTAPTDGRKFVAWCIHPDDPLEEATTGVSFNNVQMRGDNTGFGFINHGNPKFNWEYLEEKGPVFPAWKPVFWREDFPAPTGFK